MKFKIKYSKLAHHFFYLQNISLWRPWCHKEYNNAWMKITGPLSNEQRRAVQKFKNILITKENYGKLFSHVFKKEILPFDKKTRQIFRITENNFRKIWDDIKDDLPKTKENLETNLKQYGKTINKILERLKIFYNTKKLTPEFTDINIILLPNTVQCGGGKFGNENDVVIEGKFQRLSSLFFIEIIIHEMIHLYFEDYLKNELYPKFEKEIEYNPLKETITATLLPHGYFSQEFFNIPVNKSSKNYSLIKLTENYIKRNKKIDDSFLKKCIDYIKK